MKSPVYRKNTDFAPGDKVILLEPGELDFREEDAPHETVLRLSGDDNVVVQCKYTEVVTGAHLLKKVSEIDYDGILKQRSADALFIVNELKRALKARRTRR